MNLKQGKNILVISAIVFVFGTIAIMFGTVIASSYNSKQIEQATNKAAQQLKENTTYSQ